MIEVLLLCEYPTLNGGERSLLSTLGRSRLPGGTLPSIDVQGPARQAGPTSFHPVVAGPETGPLAEKLAEMGVELVPWSLFDSQGKRLPQPEARQRLAELLRKRRPGLVHANSLAMARLSGPVAAEAGLPSVGHLRDILRLGPTAVADLNRHTRLVAVSRATRDWHVAQGLDAAKTVVVYNGVDLDQFRPRPPDGRLHRELQLSPDAVLAGNIGQIILRKGQDVLARAAGMVAAELPRVHWVLVGERHSAKEETVRFEEQVHSLFSAAGLAERVHFLGARPDVDRLLPEFAWLVHAARQEPLGRVLLESAAAGLPVIATNVGGTAEIFGETAPAAALLVPPDDPPSLAAAIRQLAASPALRAQLSAAGRQRAIAEFDASFAAKQLARQYQEVLNR